MPFDHADRVNEVFVQVIYKFRYTILQRRGYAKVIKSRQVLHAFAKTDTPGVSADWNIKFCRQEKHSKVFVDSRQPTTVDLNNIDGPGLQKLFKHYPVMAMFSCSYPDRGNFPADAGVPQNVVRAGRLLHPPGVQFG